MATKTYRKHLLEQRSPGFLALGTSFVKTSFSTVWEGMVSDQLKRITFIMHSLFLPRFHQLHLRSSGIRFQRWETLSQRRPLRSEREEESLLPLGEAPRQAGKTRPPTSGLHRPPAGKLSSLLDLTQMGP